LTTQVHGETGWDRRVQRKKSLSRNHPEKKRARVRLEEPPPPKEKKVPMVENFSRSVLAPLKLEILNSDRMRCSPQNGTRKAPKTFDVGKNPSVPLRRAHPRKKSPPKGSRKKSPQGPDPDRSPGKGQFHPWDPKKMKPYGNRTVGTGTHLFEASGKKWRKMGNLEPGDF